MKKVGVPGDVALVGALDVLRDPRCIDAAAQLVAEAVGVEPELLRVADEFRSVRARLGGRRGGRASPRTSPAHAAASDASAASCARGWTSESGRSRKTKRSSSPNSASSSRNAGSARPQYGHSKSPYSTRVTGAFAGPRTWSTSGSRASEVDDLLRPPEREATRSLLRQPLEAMKYVEPTRVAPIAAARIPSFASVSCSPLKASVATSSETVKPIPATAAPPNKFGQPTGSLRPEPSRVASQEAVRMPTGLPDDVPEDDSERDRRRGGRLRMSALMCVPAFASAKRGTIT